MEAEDIQVIGWVRVTQSLDAIVSIGGNGGFFIPGMRLKDYWKQIGNEKATIYYHALIMNIVENNFRFSGNDHLDRECKGIPVFSDGTIGLFSLRAWGDLMASIWSEIDEKNYSYLDFAY